MIKKLKYILNSYNDKELEDMELWINSNEIVEAILLEEESIDLITNKSEIKIDNFIAKEKDNK